MMTYDQAKSLEVGDELIHDSGIKRKVVKYNEGKRHIWLKPRLVGKGKAASMSQTQLIAHHSLPGTVLVPEKGKSADYVGAFERAFKKDDVQHVAKAAAFIELFFVVRALNQFHKDGLIPQCPPKIEAYFTLLEEWLEADAHASRD